MERAADLPSALSRPPTEGAPMDLLNDARRLASIGTYFIVIGWIFVIYALIAGVIWWIDLAQREAFNFLEALAISLGAIGLPFFIAVLILGLGYTMRLFALYVASKAA
jgi:hypothetical protein